MVKKLFSILILFLGLYSFTTHSYAQENPWPMSGGNPERTSYTPEEVRGNLTVKWYKPFEAFILHRTQIIAANNTLFISASDGLHALDSLTGAVKWVYATPLPLGNSPTYYNGNVYAGGFDKKIHALNADTGVQIWEFEAEQGFQTNPLIVDDTLYAGNRDGNMYAIYVTGPNAGTLRWTFPTNGPILFSAAYSPQTNYIYFASNDMHAYAVDADSGSLVWKSLKLPGSGFQSWWPVVYRDKVIFAGSHNYRTSTAPFGGQLNNKFEKEDLYPTYNLNGNQCEGHFLGEPGTEPGDWAVGTPTLNLFLGYSNNGCLSNSVTEYLEQKPWRRTVFVFDAQTGIEATYDFDGDGNPEYAPITWVGTHGGTRYPPVVGSDDVLYISDQYQSDVNIPFGNIAGWKIDSPYISTPYLDRNADDEPQAYVAGGNLIYWSRCCDRKTGAFDITTPTLSSSKFLYYNYDLNQKIPGYDSNYFYNGANYTSPYAAYGGINGTYGFHGDVDPPIPYNGMVYIHEGNSVIAFGPGAAVNQALPQEPIATSNDTVSIPTKEELEIRLSEEVNKILQAGHLRPGYFSSGITDFYLSYYCGDIMLDYFHAPGDIITTLLRTLPYLPQGQQDQVKTYIQNEFNTYPPYNFTTIGWANGTAREIADLPPEFDAARASSPARNETYGYVNRAHNYINAFYSMWKYAEEFEATNPGISKQIFDTAVTKFRPMNAITQSQLPADNILIRDPYTLNAIIANYLGYMELEKLAGYTASIDQSSKYSEFVHFRDLRLNNFSKDTPYTTFGGPQPSYCRSLSSSRNFIYLVPELSAMLKSSLQPQIQTAVNEYTSVSPFWFVSKEEVEFGEGVPKNLFDLTLFQAKAEILDAPYEELAQYIDIPSSEIGDLFYINNLVSALEAPYSQASSPSPTPIPGDADNNGQVTITDFIIWKDDFTNNTSLSSDFDNDGNVTILDFIVWKNAFING